MSLLDDLKLAHRLGVVDPLQIAATTAALTRWGPNLAALYTAAAIRHPRRDAVVDHRGRRTYAALDQASTELAKGLRSLGLDAGDHIGLFGFNHGDFVETSVAAAKAGLPCVYLNTGFAAPQLAEVLAREGVQAVICDAELEPVLLSSGYSAGPVIIADIDPDDDGPDDPPSIDRHTIDAVRARGRGIIPMRPSRPVAPILLTSGTTGTPKGARRSGRPNGVTSAIGLLERVPYTTGDVSVIPTPMFHAWGLAQLTIAAATGSTAVLVRRFSPLATLEAIASSSATVLAVVPIMLQRILALDADLTSDHDTSTLRVVASSGSALPAHVATAWMDRFGDHLYNMYGSTEVGQATLATPDDLRAAPGTAGRVVRGSTVEVVDATGARLPPGEVGRIVVGNDAQFTEYTGGGTKDTVRGLMSSGDVGHFDDDGRLFVTGRSDDMIVSGGENVYPQEIEDLLVGHPEIDDAAVHGVDDAEFGQRLAAQVVVRAGSTLGPDDVRDLVAADLARHKVPRDVTFVDALPRNATGKLLRNALVP